jgi:histidine ammonia-lyase
LFNSGAVTQSIAVDYLATLRVVLDAATVAAVASCEAYGVNPSPFTREVTVTKAVPGGEKASDAIMSLLEGSWTLEQGAIPQAQHAISFRTLVPLIAVVEECVERFSDLIEREVNSSTDSPVVLHDSRTVRSSVNFQPLAAAVAGDALAIALTHWSNASANRTIKMANHSIPDVPRFLAPDEGQSVGFNALMKSTVAMATRVRFEANPGSVDFFAVSDGTEDVASQLPLVVEKLGRQVESLRRLVALEAFTAHQLVSLRQPRRWGRAATRVLDVCGRHVPVIEHDQPLGGFVDALTECIARGELH